LDANAGKGEFNLTTNERERELDRLNEKSMHKLVGDEGRYYRVINYYYLCIVINRLSIL